MVTAFVSVMTFSEKIANLPPMEVSLTRAARRAAQTVSDTAGIIETAQAETSRARALLEDRLRTAPKG